MEELFAVATEFRFDVGQAIIGSNALQGAVENLDGAVNKAANSLQYLAMGMVSHLGMGSGGVLGILTKAFKVSEEFTSDTLNFANNIGGNMQFLTGTVNTFNERLESSRGLMMEISKAANSTGLSSHDLMNTAMRFANPLNQAGKNGHNYEGAIGLAKNALVASQAVGVGPQMMTETIARALTDKMSIHGAVFQRLVGTKAFQDAHVKGQGQLTNMETGKKIDLLTKALGQLGGNAEFLAYRMNLISVQFQIFKNNVETMLLPIGEQLTRAMKKVFMVVNDYLQKYGPAIGQKIGGILGHIFDDPRGFIVNIMQLQRVKHDIRKAMDFTSFLITAGSILSFFNKTHGIGKAIEGFMGLSGGTGFIEILQSQGTVIGKTFRLIGTAIADFIPNFIAFFFLFQIISRAKAMARVEAIIHAIALAPKFIEALLKIKDAMVRIFEPLNIAIDQWARMLAALLSTDVIMDVTIWLIEKLASALSALADIVGWMLRMIKDEVTLMQEFLMDKASRNPEILKNLWSNIKTMGSDFMTLPHPPNTPSVAPPNINNYNHVEARFDMREQLEPDRIAFAVTEHLKKLTINALQGPNNSLNRGFNQKTAGAR